MVVGDQRRFTGAQANELAWFSRCRRTLSRPRWPVATNPPGALRLSNLIDWGDYDLAPFRSTCASLDATRVAANAVGPTA